MHVHNKWRNNKENNKRYLNGTLKSDLNVGCIPNVGACWIREFCCEISFCLLTEDKPRRPWPTFCGGAGGKKPCDGFKGVMCGGSLGGNGWWGDWAGFVIADTGVGLVKLPVGAEILLG